MTEAHRSADSGAPEWLWIVAYYGDLSGLKAFRSYRDAEAHAKDVAASRREAVHIYRGEWKHRAVPREPVMEDRQ